MGIGDSRGKSSSPANEFTVYNRQDLIAALIVAGEDPNVQGIIQHSRFNCTDDKGTIATSPQLFCGDQKCVEPNPGNPEAPGPNAVCKK